MKCIHQNLWIFFLRKSLKYSSIFYKILLLTSRILLFLCCGNGFEFHWRSEPGRNRAAWGAWLQVCLETWDYSQPVFVLMLIWEHLPSSSRLCLLLSSFFSLIFSLPKTALCMFKKKNRGGLLKFANEIRWKWCLFYIAEFGQDFASKYESGF